MEFSGPLEPIPKLFITHEIRSFAGEFHPEPTWDFVPVLLIPGHPWSFRLHHAPTIKLSNQFMAASASEAW